MAFVFVLCPSVAHVEQHSSFYAARACNVLRGRCGFEIHPIACGAYVYASVRFCCCLLIVVAHLADSRSFSAFLTAWAII